VKANPRCDHADGDRRCPNSAGYRVKQPPFQLRPGRFCLRHARALRARHDYVVPLAKLHSADR
jgi:hypothetical protein